jgi:hypothetical protein
MRASTKSKISRQADQLLLFVAIINKASSSANEPALQHFHPVIGFLAKVKTNRGRA